MKILLLTPRNPILQKGRLIKTRKAQPCSVVSYVILFYNSWLQWCRSNKNVKCTESAVPDGILPKGFTGILIDVKVHGKGPDDKVYGQHPELRAKVFKNPKCI